LPNGAWEFSLLQKKVTFFNCYHVAIILSLYFLQIQSKSKEDTVFAETSKRAGAFSLQQPWLPGLFVQTATLRNRLQGRWLALVLAAAYFLPPFLPGTLSLPSNKTQEGPEPLEKEGF